MNNENKLSELRDVAVDSLKQANAIVPLFFLPDCVTFDNIETSPIKQLEDCCEVCDKGEEDFWSVYLHNVEGGAVCVADVATEEQANALVELLKYTSTHYKDNGYL